MTSAALIMLVVASPAGRESIASHLSCCPAGVELPLSAASAGTAAADGDGAALRRRPGADGCRGHRALRQFTSDRLLLHRAVDAMHWAPPTGLQAAFPGMSLFREMDHVLAELGAFPGRKSVVLVAPGTFAQLSDVRAMADRANRTSVT